MHALLISESCICSCSKTVNQNKEIKYRSCSALIRSEEYAFIEHLFDIIELKNGLVAVV